MKSTFLARTAWITGAAALVALGALFVADNAMAGIAATKHNLSTSGTGANRVTAGTDEICVFCHTPHGSDTSAAVPLWNKKLPSSAGYTLYSALNSSTIDGEILTVGSVSLACLSCHDGTQAMDNIINAPGSGGYDSTGGGTAGLSYTWTTTANVNASGQMINGVDGGGTNIALIGTDLRNDHPIGVRYCGGGPSASNATANCVDADFKGASSGLQNATINSQLVWWVDTSAGTAGQRDKTDMILYTRAFAGGNAPSVECATCHDPHVEQGTGSAGATFLRISNTGSAVCLACHVK